MRLAATGSKLVAECELDIQRRGFMVPAPAVSLRKQPWIPLIRIRRKLCRLTSSSSRWGLLAGYREVTYAAARLGLADHLAGGPKSAEELAGPLSAHAAVPSPADANARQPGHPHRARGPALRPDASRRGAENRCTGIRESLLAYARQPLVQQRLRSYRAFRSDRGDRVRKGPGHAGLRLPRAASGRCITVQRDDDRHTWRGAGSRRRRV